MRPYPRRHLWNICQERHPNLIHAVLCFTFVRHVRWNVAKEWTGYSSKEPSELSDVTSNRSKCRNEAQGHVVEERDGVNHVQCGLIGEAEGGVGVVVEQACTRLPVCLIPRSPCGRSGWSWWLLVPAWPRIPACCLHSRHALVDRAHPISLLTHFLSLPTSPFFLPFFTNT